MCYSALFVMRDSRPWVHKNQRACTVICSICRGLSGRDFAGKEGFVKFAGYCEVNEETLHTYHLDGCGACNEPVTALRVLWADIQEEKGKRGGTAAVSKQKHGVTVRKRHGSGY